MNVVYVRWYVSIFYGQYACDRLGSIDNDFLIRNGRADFLSIIHCIANN